MSVNFPAVHDHFLYAFLHMTGIPDTDVIDAFSECACELEITEIIGDAGIDAQTVESGIYAQDVLGDIRG